MDVRVRLQPVEFIVRIEVRIFVIETHDEADRNVCLVEAVDETSAETVGGRDAQPDRTARDAQILLLQIPAFERAFLQREAERVDDFSGWKSAGRKFPQFFHAQRVRLRVTIAVEAMNLDEMFGQA